MLQQHRKYSMNKNIQSLGGIAKGKIQREEALKKYYDNPNICKECGKIIIVKEKEKVCFVRKKQVCSQSCNAKYNNKLRIRIKKAKIKKDKILLITDFTTKGELKLRLSSWQSWRTAIQHNACKKMKSIEYKCNKCGYTTHNQVCHIKPVSSFNDNSTLGEINNISNLLYLCPTHHWELDNIPRMARPSGLESLINFQPTRNS